MYVLLSCLTLYYLQGIYFLHFNLHGTITPVLTANGKFKGVKRLTKIYKKIINVLYRMRIQKIIELSTILT